MILPVYFVVGVTHLNYDYVVKPDAADCLVVSMVVLYQMD
jgi:hypothetical protein